MNIINGERLKSEIERRRNAAKTLTGLDFVQLINEQPEVITRCCECKNWDKESGLTARMCAEWCKVTTQYEYCSRGVKINDRK